MLIDILKTSTCSSLAVVKAFVYSPRKIIVLIDTCHYCGCYFFNSKKKREGNKQKNCSFEHTKLK